ncbi:MAG: ferrochelatase [Chloroflexi bacterium]|nr:MAG: ferrochelatase [Chloroflexota bacterium]
MKIAVIISNMGGPDSLAAVEPYLVNIFSDPDIIDIPLPSPLRMRFVRWFAGRRAAESREIYHQLGGKTPLTAITQQQAELLAARLNATGLASFAVFPAMRYWHPLVEDVWQAVRRQGFDKLVVVTLYPFFSTTTTGSLIRLVNRLNAQGDFPPDDLLIVDRFGDHPAFIRAMAGQIRRALAAAETTGVGYHDLLLSAHSIPMRRIKRGDPYQREIEAAVAALRPHLPPDLRLHLAYQSKIGPIRWLSPATPDKIDELAAAGVKNLLVYPLGFVADNSETLYEINMLYKDQAHARGIENFVCIEALNIDPHLIEALERVVVERLQTYWPALFQSEVREVVAGR